MPERRLRAQLANLYELYLNSTGGSGGSGNGTVGGNSTTAGNSTRTGTGNSTTSGKRTSSSNSTAAARIRQNATAEISFHRRRSQEIAEAILDLNWDRQRAWFYVSNSRRRSSEP